MNNDVFISYVTPNLEFAENLLEHLKSRGFNCFFAPRNMIGGQEFAGELIRAVRNSRSLLFIHSKYANVHDINVLAEIRAARDNNIPIILIKLDGTELNDEFTYYLSGLHTISYSPNNFEQCAWEAELALNAIMKKYPTEEEAQRSIEFLYVPEFGIMINPADGERNVSFRTDTFISMMGGIYEKVAEIAGVENAGKIFFDSGYESGKNFAVRINSKWGNGFSIEEMKKKIQKWCAFDSLVGWGKFEADIQFDEENDTFGGTLTITEAFIVDTQHKRKVCEFIRGYCTGVLDTLLGDLDVELVCASCRLEKKLSRKCVFEIKMKG